MYKKAVITDIGQPLRIMTSQLEKPPPGHVRIRTAFAGVCHTDIGIIDQDFLNLRETFGEHNYKGLVLGHEISGYIDDVGEGIKLSKHSLQIGDPVIVLHSRGCQECDTCKCGYPNTCLDTFVFSHNIGIAPHRPGGFQTHMNIPPESLRKVPEGMTMETAAMMSCSVGTAYGAIQKLEGAIKYGEETSGKARIAAIGCGGLGLWAIQLMKIMFKERITLVAADILESKLEQAIKYGADEGILFDRSKPLEENISRLTAGGRFHGIVDFCGTPMTINLSVEALQRNGVLSLVGAENTKMPLDFQDIVVRAITITGVLNYSDQEMNELIDIVKTNRLTLDNLEFFELDDVNEALEKLRKGQLNSRAMIKY